MPITSRRGSKLAVLAAVPLLIGLFVGCSAGGASTPSPESGAELTDQQKYDEWQLKLNACMKPKGYDLPAPGNTSGKGLEIDDQAAFEAAMGECMDEVGPGPGGTIDKKASDAMLEGVIKLNACLRERGYDVKDPEPGSKSISMSADVKPEDMEACQAETGGGGLSAG